MRLRFGIVVGVSLCVGGVMSSSGQSVPANAPPTFNKDVAPILFKQCAGCHRPGEAAPMSLVTYEDARPRARAIARAVVNRTMPPWHTDAPAGTFHNERVLSDAERDILVKWADTGALRGEAQDLPPTPSFSDNWTYGTPDLVVDAEEYAVPATGTVEYEYLYVDAPFTDGKWVKAIEVRPGNRALVHHVLVYYIAKDAAAKPPLARGVPSHMAPSAPSAQGRNPQRRPPAGAARRLVATYAPGTNPQIMPEGTALRLEGGGVFELQMHYTTNGQAGTDRTRIGLTFAKEESPNEVRAQHFFNAMLRLPAGAPNVSVSTELTFLEDSTMWGIFPHTHLRGKRWEYHLVGPDGTSRPVLSVPRYDFNWQTYYMFREPLQVAKGSKLVSTAWYDNSRGNRFNPDPDTDVLWGDQTWEEMQYTGVLLSQR